MAPHFSMTIFLPILAFTVSIISTSLGERELSSLQEVEIQRHLKRLNKPAVKSIESPDGDIIDCVHIANQPAFDHPLLKNHTLQMRPSFRPKGISWKSEEQENALTQIWHMNGSCPENTIPIRRTRKEDLLRWNSINDYGKKYQSNIPKHKSNLTEYDDPENHEYVKMAEKGTFLGGGAHINVWKPHVEPDEFSLGQIWIIGGAGVESSTVEAGWQVYPKMYGDDNPRFFIYWTGDGYGKTGCYNLICQGFVQTNNKVAIGGGFNHISTYDGPQYHMELLIFRELASENWWLEFNGRIIGYWPKEILIHMYFNAWIVQWGGEVVNLKKDGGQHTTTAMGSGHFVEEGYKKASFISNMIVVDESNVKRKSEKFEITVSHENCYNMLSGKDDPNFGTYFYFGGPGRNPNCK